jgi:hypothetical protein
MGENGCAMDEGPRSKELPLWVQHLALFALWIVWLALAVWVPWRAKLLEQYGWFYEDPFMVYALLYAGIPLVLVLGGLRFFRRAGPVASLRFAYRLAYYVMAGITLLGAVVFLVGCVGALLIPLSAVRE